MMGLSICVALASGTVLTVLPTSTVTLKWFHTVEHSNWEEDYSASEAGLRIIEARIETMGAGMEPPHFAVRTEQGWRYRPELPPLASITLANSSFATGYSICWNSECRPLASIVEQDRTATITTSRCSNNTTESLPTVEDNRHGAR